MKPISVARFGLRTSDIEQINMVFSFYPEIEEVILYGSRARGNYRPGSDIDLTVVSATLTELQLAWMEVMLDDLLLPYKIDLSLYRHLTSPSLLEQIHQTKKLFFTSKK